MIMMRKKFQISVKNAPSNYIHNNPSNFMEHWNRFFYLDDLNLIFKFIAKNFWKFNYWIVLGNERESEIWMAWFSLWIFGDLLWQIETSIKKLSWFSIPHSTQFNLKYFIHNSNSFWYLSTQKAWLFNEILVILFEFSHSYNLMKNWCR